MVRQERGARAASQHGADARGGESPVDPAIDQRRHHGHHRFGGAVARVSQQETGIPPPNPPGELGTSLPVLSRNSQRKPGASSGELILYSRSEERRVGK